MPVLNTGHIAAETANEFDAHGDKVLWCICAPYECGWFISVQSDYDSTELSLPPDLRFLFKWALAKGYDWLRLDCDGDIVASLPLYAW